MARGLDHPTIPAPPLRAFRRVDPALPRQGSTILRWASPRYSRGRATLPEPALSKVEGADSPVEERAFEGRVTCPQSGPAFRPRVPSRTRSAVGAINDCGCPSVAVSDGCEPVLLAASVVAPDHFKKSIPDWAPWCLRLRKPRSLAQLRPSWRKGGPASR